ncbi:MAG: type IV conjugative transfer system protein TraE [Betaproteobacteria bacterium]|nr:type IV conjugative transfer system protein TraE [Betaproteobacteria bacterium]
MDFDRLNTERKDLIRRNRMLSLIACGLVISQILTLTALLSVIGSERTVLVPPSINKTFWVAGQRASGEYLEQMGAFISWLMLDVSPSSIDWKKEILLTYVEPDQHGQFKAKQEVEADRLKRINAATAFAPEQLVPSEDGQSVVIRGRLRTLVNGMETTNDPKAYLVEFSFGGSRMHLKTFKEIPYASKH